MLLVVIEKKFRGIICHSPIFFNNTIMTLKTLHVAVNILSAHHVLDITAGRPSDSVIRGPILINNKITSRSVEILPSVRRI